MSHAIDSISRLHTATKEHKHESAKNVPRFIFLVSILSLSTFSCGYSIAYIVALGYNNVKIVYGDTAVLPVVRAFLIAALPFGISFGTLITPWILTLATRRNLTLTLSLIAECLLGIIQIQSLVDFFIVRALQGVVTGIFLILIPLYIKEISPKQITTQTAFGVFEKSFLLFGFVVPLGLNIIMLKTQLDQFIRWRIIVTANALPILVVIISILINFIPESPISLIQNGKAEQARRVIGLFHRQSCVEQIYADKVKQIEIIEKIQTNTGHAAKHVCKLRAFLTFQIPVVHQFTGVNAYISQMGLIVSAYNPGLSDYVPFAMVSMQLITLIVSMFYVTRLTTRRIILIGNLGMSVCCLGIGTSLLVINSFNNAIWIIFACIIVFMGFNGATFIPAVGLYVTEVGNRKLVRWSLVVNWFTSAVVIVLFISISSVVGYPAVFLGFGVMSFIGFIFNLIWMIQTKPKPKKSGSIQLITVKRNKKQDKK